MSGQLLELLIFAGIAFFIISKLITILGSTNEDDRTKYTRNSFFGEPASSLKEVKSVVNTPGKGAGIVKKFRKKPNLTGLIVVENKDDVISGLREAQEKLPSFTVQSFIKGAKAAFKMIIESGNNNDEDELEELVDKRYIEHFKEISSSYGNFQDSSADITAEISEIYTFGNNIFVKVLFLGRDVTDKISDLHEEWTFSKSAISAESTWHLNNIDRPQ